MLAVWGAIVGMVNVEQHIEYWRSGAAEDLAIADKLVRDDHRRHGLFFAHLALEKLLKAHVCQQTQDLAPYTHSLLRLARLAELRIDENQTRLLDQIGRFNIEGRYPESSAAPSREQTSQTMAQVWEMVQWLTDQF